MMEKKEREFFCPLVKKFRYDFIDQCLSSLIEFDDYWHKRNLQTAICIPQCLDVCKSRQLRSIDRNADNFDTVEHQKVQANLKGQCGEDIFFKMYQSSTTGGVIVARFDSQDFRKKIKSADLDQRFKHLIRSRITQDFECDFLILHPVLGIYVVEVKAMKDNSTDPAVNRIISKEDVLDHAIKQLSNSVLQIRSLIATFASFENETNILLPVQGVICCPFADLSPQARPQNVIFMDQEFFLSQASFDAFWTEHIISVTSKCHLYQRNYFRRFIGAVVGYRSAVFHSELKNALEINRIFTEQSYNKPLCTKKTDCDKEKKSYSRAKEHKKVIVDDLNNQHPIFLTPKQLEILNCTSKVQIIYGPPGTGKTLIVLLKALKAARIEKKGKVLFDAGTHELSSKVKFFFFNSKNLKRTPIVFSGDEEKLEADDDFFADEQIATNRSAFLRERLNCSGCTIIAVTGFESPTKVVHMSQLLDSLPDEKFDESKFADFQIKTVVRGTRNIVDVWKEYYPNNYINLGHNITGDEVSREAFSNCSEILRRIFETLVRFGVQTQKRLIRSKQKASDCPIAIITESRECTSIVKKYLLSYGISCGTVADQLQNRNLVVVDQHQNTLSYEWPVVISVSFTCTYMFPSFLLISASRAIAKLVIIERDYISAQKFLDDRLSRYNMTTIELTHVREEISDAAYFRGERTPIILLADAAILALRLKYFPNEIRSLERFKHCSSLLQFIQILNEDNFLCHLFAKTATKLVRYTQMIRKSWHVAHEPPNKLLKFLWHDSNSISEKDTEVRWNILSSFVSKLEDIMCNRSSSNPIPKQPHDAELLTLAFFNRAEIHWLIDIISFLNGILFYNYAINASIGKGYSLVTLSPKSQAVTFNRKCTTTNNDYLQPNSAMIFTTGSKMRNDTSSKQHIHKSAGSRRSWATNAANPFQIPAVKDLDMFCFKSDGTNHTIFGLAQRKPCFYVIDIIGDEIKSEVVPVPKNQFKDISANFRWHAIEVLRSAVSTVLVTLVENLPSRALFLATFLWDSEDWRFKKLQEKNLEIKMQDKCSFLMKPNNASFETIVKEDIFYVVLMKHPPGARETRVTIRSAVLKGTKDIIVASKQILKPIARQWHMPFIHSSKLYFLPVDELKKDLYWCNLLKLDKQDILHTTNAFYNYQGALSAPCVLENRVHIYVVDGETLAGNLYVLQLATAQWHTSTLFDQKSLPVKKIRCLLSCSKIGSDLYGVFLYLCGETLTDSGFNFQLFTLSENHSPALIPSITQNEVPVGQSQATANGTMQLMLQKTQLPKIVVNESEYIFLNNKMEQMRCRIVSLFERVNNIIKDEDVYSEHMNEIADIQDEHIAINLELDAVKSQIKYICKAFVSEKQETYQIMEKVLVFEADMEKVGRDVEKLPQSADSREDESNLEWFKHVLDHFLSDFATEADPLEIASQLKIFGVLNAADITAITSQTTHFKRNNAIIATLKTKGPLAIDSLERAMLNKDFPTLALKLLSLKEDVKKNEGRQRSETKSSCDE